MSAEVRYEAVASCADCVDGMDWHDGDAEEWAEQHNREHHPETETP